MSYFFNMFLLQGRNMQAAPSLEEVTEIATETVKEMPVYLKKFFEIVQAIGWKIIWAVVFYIVGKKLIKWLVKFLQNLFGKSKIDEGVSKFLVSLIKTICNIGLFLGVILVLTDGKMGGLAASVTAIVGSAGLTIGLALQGSLQNFSGGVLILLLKPFKLGDYIIAQGYEGTVETIDIFYTKLLTIDNRMVVLPNGALSNTNITNVTREEIRRLDLTVGIEYSENVAKVKSILYEIINSKEQVLTDYDINVYVNDFEASSISMGLRMWCKTEDYWPLRWDMLESIKEAFDRNNIVIPFDQLDVNVKQQVESKL